VARERPTASDVRQVLSDFDAGSTEGLVSAGATPGFDSMLSPAQMRALRRSERLTSAECHAHRRTPPPAAAPAHKHDSSPG
jgi:hypothetical protein